MRLKCLIERTDQRRARAAPGRSPRTGRGLSVSAAAPDGALRHNLPGLAHLQTPVRLSGSCTGYGHVEISSLTVGSSPRAIQCCQPRGPGWTKASWDHYDRDMCARFQTPSQAAAERCWKLVESFWMRNRRWAAWFLLPAISDRERLSSALLMIVLLACFLGSSPICSATVPIGGPKGSTAATALKQNSWIQQRELTAADGARNDVFGYSVAVSEQTAIVGAAGKNIGNNPGQGAAYVLTCAGTPCTWTQQQELTAADGARDDEFGNSVAMSGHTALIGAWGKHSLYMPGAPMTAVAPQGAAYVFTCSGTPCTWTQQQELTAVDGRRGDVFGYSVAVSGNTVIIGAIGQNSPRGAAYVFTCSGTPCTWTQQQELTAADGASGDVFGTRVAVSGATTVIGAPGKTIGNNALQGAAYVFTCSGNPCTWTPQQELTAADGARGDEFGYSVAVSGKTTLIGAAYKNSYQGAAYVFNSPAFEGEHLRMRDRSRSTSRVIRPASTHTATHPLSAGS